MNVDLLNTAIDWACIAHRRQLDRGQQPYILHPLRVMLTCVKHGETAMLAAILHDTVEDSGVSLEGIRRVFGTNVASTVDSVSRRNGEMYKEFIARAASHPIGRLVKIEDIKDNMLPERKVPGLKGLMQRYEKALALLEGH